MSKGALYRDVCFHGSWKSGHVLYRRLNMKGKPTRIFLSTTARDKPGELVDGRTLSEVEVCGLEDARRVGLPKSLHAHAAASGFKRETLQFNNCKSVRMGTK